ncbi:MAG: hypothetical protein DRH24_06470 [Deltaproteobacteria bacterium]|nr:MAG: hypothetical protein DRH24_06470 [Deltaproteobacteria bacterium]
MARGMQDFWISSEIDILSQTLQYLTQRPYYGDGKAMMESGISLNMSTFENIVNLTGKGRVYGGIVTFRGMATDNLVIQFILDAEVLSYTTLESYWKYRIHGGASTPFRFVKYDEVNQIYAFSINAYIQYEVNFVIQARNVYSNAGIANVILFYAAAEE